MAGAAAGRSLSAGRFNQWLTAYLDEMEWRFNNRQNEFPFRDMLMRLVAGEAITYEELTA